MFTILDFCENSFSVQLAYKRGVVIVIFALIAPSAFYNILTIFGYTSPTL